MPLQYDRSAEAKVRVENLLGALRGDSEDSDASSLELSSLEPCSGTSGISLTSVNFYLAGHALIAYRKY